MAESVHAFSLPLGPAQPGLTDGQLKKRKAEAYRIVFATMPSAKFLINCLLEERIVSHHELLWLAFHLVETPQLPLLNSSAKRSRDRVLSTMNVLLTELERLKAEAEATVIRVGELAAFSAAPSALSESNFFGDVEELSTQDMELWRLIHERKGKRISIEFATGSVGITMPLFCEHLAEKQTRQIRFLVIAVTRTKAQLTVVEEVKSDGIDEGEFAKCPKSIQLLRPHCNTRAERDAWFLLYAAEFRNLPVEATVRMALRLSDYSPSHLELISIVIDPHLTAVIEKIGGNLGPC